MIEMAAVRDAYQKREIYDICHVPGYTNPADALAKKCKSAFLYALMNGVENVAPAQ